MATESDWTQGPARWFAVGVLLTASLGGIVWALAQRHTAAPEVIVVHAPPHNHSPLPPAPPPSAPRPSSQSASKPPAGSFGPFSPGLPEAPLHGVPEPEIDPADAAEATDAEATEAPQASSGPLPEPEPAAPGPATHLPAAPLPEVPAPVVGLTRIININTANAAELELLPGIGPTLAGRIVDYRREYGYFRSVDELGNVSGIGPKTLNRLRPRIRIH